MEGHLADNLLPLTLPVRIYQSKQAQVLNETRQQLLPVGSLLVCQQSLHSFHYSALQAAECSQGLPNDADTALPGLPGAQQHQLHLQQQHSEAALSQPRTAPTEAEADAHQGKLQKLAAFPQQPAQAPGCHTEPLQATALAQAVGPQQLYHGWASPVPLLKTLECHHWHPGEEHNSQVIPSE